MFIEDIENKKSSKGPGHPSAHWYEYKSAPFEKKQKAGEGYFKYRVKNANDEWEDVVIPYSEFPQEFVVIAESFSIGGWDNANKRPIKGPEIFDYFGEYTALSGGNVYWKGKWDEVPEELFIWRNLHVFDPKNPNEFYTIKLKTTQSTEWFGTFSKDENKGAYIRKRIAFGDEKEMKHGASQWTIPTYKATTDLTEEDKANRKKFSDILRNYHAEVDKKFEEENEGTSVTDAIKENNESKYDENNLPF